MSTVSSVLAFAEKYGLPFLDSSMTPLVDAVLVSSPDATDTYVESEIVGALKHQAREALKEIGFLVDVPIFWSPIAGYLTDELAKIIPQVRAANVASVPAAPAPEPPARSEAESASVPATTQSV